VQCCVVTSQGVRMSARVPWLPRSLLDAPAYGVLGPHRQGDHALTVDYVAVVACALGDHALLALASAPASA
jgi:hypothetical protein